MNLFRGIRLSTWRRHSRGLEGVLESLPEGVVLRLYIINTYS